MLTTVSTWIVASKGDKSVSAADKDIGSILKTVRKTLISSVGGASGPLWHPVPRAGTAVDGKQDLTDEDMVKLLQAGLDGVIQRGKAQLGDKTMVEAIARRGGFSANCGMIRVLSAMQQAVAAAAGYERYHADAC